MNRISQFIIVVALLALPLAALADTALTYQGRLLDAGKPANGTFNLGFSLWDAAINGNQVGATQMLYYTPVNDGLFTVQIDFGADAFNNNDRWLNITVDGVTLSPRQPITRAPYSIQTRGIIVNDDQHVGMGISPSSARLRVWNFAGNGFEVLSSSRAVEAISTGDMAILASNQSAEGIGVYAQHQPTGNQGWLGSPDYGVYGIAGSPAWAGYFMGKTYVDGPLLVGRETQINSAERFGVHSLVSSGDAGMFVSTQGVNASPFYGYATGGTEGARHYYDGSWGKWHLYNNGVRLTVTSEGNVGIGTTFPGTKLTVSGGDATFLGFVGIGTSQPSYPLQVSSNESNTIYTVNTMITGTAVYGVATSSTNWAVGVEGESLSSSGAGVYGYASATTGLSRGVSGQSESANGSGVHGYALSSSGLNYGVYGRTNSPSGYSVFSNGDYGGSGAKYFVQPHPYDPSKEIRFVCLEGNESGTYFRGSTQLVDGRAIIDVPEEFRLVTETEGLTVQVTAKGPKAGLWVETESLDQIIVRGNGNVKFNYFVNGVRRGFNDMELMRENHTYVPEVRGVPFGTQYRDGQRQILVDNGILNPDFTPNEQTAAMMGWTLRDPTPDELSRARSNDKGEDK